MAANGVLHVPAFIDRDPAGGDNAWLAAVPPLEGAFTGLFATGDTFHAARRRLAETVWASVQNTDTGIDPSSIGAVRIWARTRATFPVAELAGDPQGG